MENNEELINQFAEESIKQWDEQTAAIESQLAELKDRRLGVAKDNIFRKCIDQDISDLEAALYYRSMIQ